MLVGAVNRAGQSDRFALREAIFAEQRDIVADVSPQTGFCLVGRFPIATAERSDRSADILKSQSDADIRRERCSGEEVVSRIDHQTGRREVTVGQYAAQTTDISML